MASVRERIILAVVAAQDAPGKPAGLTVHRRRYRPIDADKLPALVVYPVQEDPELANITPGDWDRTLRVRLELRAKADPESGSPADAELDPLYVWAVKQMYADPTFGGLVKQVDEGTTAWPDKNPLGDEYAASATDFTLEFETVATDPETAK